MRGARGILGLDRSLGTSLWKPRLDLAPSISADVASEVSTPAFFVVAQEPEKILEITVWSLIFTIIVCKM